MRKNGKFINPHNKTVVDRIITFCNEVTVVNEKGETEAECDPSIAGVLCFQWKVLGWSLYEVDEQLFHLYPCRKSHLYYVIRLKTEVYAVKSSKAAVCSSCLRASKPVTKIYCREHQINLCSNCLKALKVSLENEQ